MNLGRTRGNTIEFRRRRGVKRVSKISLSACIIELIYKYRECCEKQEVGNAGASHGTRLWTNDSIQVPAGHPSMSGKGLKNLSQVLAPIGGDKPSWVLHIRDKFLDLGVGKTKLTEPFD